ncbi:MAG: hypothetical protein PHW74_14420 [Desulfobacca sp.]|nr:hypothetical protein [Desulfobacca sp.]
MRKMMLSGMVIGVFGLSWFLLTASPLSAQWGTIRRGVDAARQAAGEKAKPAEPTSPSPTQQPRAEEGPTGEAVSTAAVTYKNNGRKFSYTIPAGWDKPSGDPRGERASFHKPGTTVSYAFHYTGLGSSFPREASVKASMQQAQEQMKLGKYLSVKRRDQKDAGIIGWETVESAKGSGGFQRIQWQCYDQQNFYYTFMASCEPPQFDRYRAEMQRLIDSVKFSR